MAYSIVCGPQWNDILGDYFQRHAGGEYRQGAQCFGMLRDGKIIACVLFDGHNGASIYMHVASSARNWITREYIRAVFDYAFRQLGCRASSYRDWETDRKSTRLNSSHRSLSRMPSSA